MQRSAEPSSRVRASRNILLQRLSTADQDLIEPHVEERTIACGVPVIGAEEVLDAIYFPGTALISVEQRSDTGGQIEVALVGREGLLGWPALLGAVRSSHSATARMRHGTLLRVPLEPLRDACSGSPSLQAALLQFVHVMIVQMTRAICSNLEHPLDQRVARWLLMRHDRVNGDVLDCQHAEIAESMNVRRASVTDSLHVIEGARAVRCTRGRIVVRDRSGLERLAGTAYGTAETQYRGLIAPFGKSLPRPAA